MKYKAIALFVLTIVTTGSVSQNSVKIHNGFLKASEYLDLDSGSQRIYAMGVLDGMYMAPMFGAQENNKVLLRIASCAEGMKSSQVAAIIEKYVRNHPERWNWDLKDAAYSSMLEACPNPKIKIRAIPPICRVGRRELEKMSVRGLDYGALLSEAKPEVIHGEEQNRLFLKTLERLASKRSVTAAERKLIELLTVLIEDFEARAYGLKDAEPVEVIRHLMEENKLRQKDLLDVFKTESIASDVLNGKRELTKEHIRRLSKRFGVSPAAFF